METLPLDAEDARAVLRRIKQPRLRRDAARFNDPRFPRRR